MPSGKKADHQIMNISLFWVCLFLCKQKQLSNHVTVYLPYSHSQSFASRNCSPKSRLLLLDPGADHVWNISKLLPWHAEILEKQLIVRFQFPYHKTIIFAMLLSPLIQFMNPISVPSHLLLPLPVWAPWPPIHNPDIVINVLVVHVDMSSAQRHCLEVILQRS